MSRNQKTVIQSQENFKHTSTEKCKTIHIATGIIKIETK